jgi:heme/copper-type cytochrome/quinol oxidase subunit 3
MRRLLAVLWTVLWAGVCVFLSYFIGSFNGSLMRLYYDEQHYSSSLEDYPKLSIFVIAIDLLKVTTVSLLLMVPTSLLMSSSCTFFLQRCQLHLRKKHKMIVFVLFLILLTYAIPIVNVMYYRMRCCAGN